MKLFANLGDPHPYAHEFAQGHWDVPGRVYDRGLRPHMPTNKRLFKEWPTWCLICVYNPLHVHESVKSDGGTKITEGVWWIYECHPQILDKVEGIRKYAPTFPLLFSRFDDGEMYADQSVKGQPFSPENGDTWPLITKTLSMKDIFNTTTELGDNIRDADRANDEREALVESKLKTYREEAVRELVDDLRWADGSRINTSDSGKWYED